MPPPTRRLEKNDELTWAEGDANLDAFDSPSPRVTTISAGIATITGPGVWFVETEGGASADDLIGLTGGSGRLWPVTLMINTPGRVVHVIHTPPNFCLLNGEDFDLTSAGDNITLHDRTAGVWYEKGARGSVPTS